MPGSGTSTTVLYISSSSYSGSTLLAFLLNGHPEIATVSEMEGWPYGERESFTCSCGKILGDCPLFQFIAQAFVREGLPFAYRDFGTRYRLAEHGRLNRYLAAELPVSSSRIERARDAVLRRIPPLARRLARQHLANRVFIRAGLAYKGAAAWVDASKSAFRLRYLRRAPGLDLRALYLVRDLRAFALSNKVKWGWDVGTSTRVWLRQQVDIQRIATEAPPSVTVFYEMLCDRVMETLAQIHAFVGVKPRPFDGDFRAMEHHILGNAMRLSGVSAIVKDTRWQTELTSAELDTIGSLATDFTRRHPGHPVTTIVHHYLGR